MLVPEATTDLIGFAICIAALVLAKIVSRARPAADS
jgi:hypothetical protein